MSEEITYPLDDELCKKLAVWLCDHALKNASYYVQECRTMLRDYTQNGMNDTLLHDIRNASNQPELTKIAATELLDGEIKKGLGQLALWQQQPRDTNARFFRMKYQQVNWEA